MAVVVAAWLGLALPVSAHAAALPWLATGLAVGIVLRLGRALIPWVAAGLALSMILVGPLSWPSALLTAVVDVLLLGVLSHALERHQFGAPMIRRRDLNLYAGLVLAVSPWAFGAIETLALSFSGGAELSGQGISWIANSLRFLLGNVLVAPLLVAWDPGFLEPLVRRTRQFWIDFALFCASTVTCAWAMLTPESHAYDALCQMVTILLLALMAVRRGIALPAAAGLVAAALSIRGTWAGTAPFGPDPEQALQSLWGHLAMMCFAIIVFSAVTAELRASGERWRLALSGSSIGLGDWLMETGRLYLSSRLKEMLGYQDHEIADHYEEWRSRLHPDDVPRVEHALRAHLRGDAPHVHSELRLRCKDGSWRWFEVHGSVVTRSLAGRGLRFVGYAIDINARKAVAERLRLAANLFENLHEGLIITDVDHRIIEVNQAFERLSGNTTAELHGQLPELLRSDLQSPELLAEMWAALRSHGSWKGEAQGLRHDGSRYPQQVTISVVRDDSGLITHHVLVVSDVTQARRAREQLEFQAHYDPLTELPNRHLLQKMMREAIAAVDRDREPRHQLAVCYLDMDHFKPVNDRFGHGVGDQLLASLANRLKAAMRDGDAVARLGGDEFVLLLKVNSHEECAHAVERILADVTQPYEIDNHGTWRLTASIGVTVYPQDRVDPDTLLRHADHAMYGAKQAGRNRVQFFDAEGDRQTLRRREALRRLEQAIRQGELLLHYQPKINMRDHTPVGVEALLRWQHPERGLLPPGEFLPLSEAPELLVHLGDWVLLQAVRQLSQWRSEGVELAVSVNVSGAHLQHPRFVLRLGEILRDAGLTDASGLELEVLETAAFEDVELTSRVMERCRQIGARFALDDFGTGYSTLTYLKRLPIEVLKIDHSFVRSMLTDAQDLAIVEGVIGLSRTFGCTVVAEGVESLEHARQLVKLGCDIGQGYGIASPMPASEVPQWLRTRSVAPPVPTSPHQPLLF